MAGGSLVVHRFRVIGFKKAMARLRTIAKEQKALEAEAAAVLAKAKRDLKKAKRG